MFRFLIITLSVLFLHGCAFIQARDSNLPQQIDQWVAADEYAKALNTLKYVAKSHKHYALLMNKKRRILLQAKEFENNSHAMAQTAEKNLQWNKANNIYENALNKLPENSFLQTEYRDFIKRRDDYLENLEFKLSISKGSWLIESRPIQKTIIAANPANNRAENRYRDAVQEMDETAKDLLRCTEVAIQAGRSALAETCLQTASELSPTYIDKTKLKKLRAQLAKTHQKRITRQSNRTRELINELKQGYSHDNLQRAQRHLSTIRESDMKNSESKKLTAQLSTLFKKGLANRIESGRRLYSDGKIQDALSIWIPLQSIAPDNAKLEEHIKRAKRVLAKVKKLSDNPATIKGP